MDNSLRPSPVLKILQWTPLTYLLLACGALPTAVDLSREPDLREGNLSTERVHRVPVSRNIGSGYLAI